MMTEEKKLVLPMLSAVLAVTVTMVVLDLTWLGVVARDFYDSSLGALKRQDVYWPAAALFYSMYIASIVVYAVLGASKASDAFRRGAGLGFVCYGTYEFTNWAVLRGWPGVIVPLDLAWGIALTATVSWVGKLAQLRVERRT